MSDGDLNPFVYEFDDLILGPFAKFIGLTNLVGGHVKDIVDMTNAAVMAQRDFLVVASKSSKPTSEVLAKLLKPTSDLIQSIQAFREKNRISPHFDFLSAISESIPALGWVAVSPTPAPYVKEMKDASQYYTNKILVANKNSNQTNVDWAKTWIEFLTELQTYVKKNHTTGLVWNPKGVDASTVGGRTGDCNMRPLPPPPPPPPADFFSEPAKGGDSTRNALLQELNRGTDITKSLKKVTADQQTHKNPALKSQGVVSASDLKASNNGFSAAKEAPAKPPKFELDGKKWLVEYQNGRKDIVIPDAEMNQSVNLYKCKDTLVQIKGKVNSVIVDSCIKTAVVFENIVAVVEFVNCQSIQAQSMGKVPTINIEKTDGAQIFLNKESIDAEIVTAKCSAVNVSVHDAKLDDYVEHPIPEQFKSIWNGKGFTTAPADNTS
ncbi:Adenylyl cyclase-associated protein 2 [Halotydeus destructor]|nr:Adenylyl cyclase-associated protein 2 [Halotydeus destructor]